MGNKVLRIAGLLLIDGNKVCLQLRDNKPGISYPNKWTIPGGSIEEGEDFEISAKREFLEETGYKVNKCDILGKFSHEEGFFVVFTAIFDGIQKIQCNEGQKMEWISLNDFGKLDLIPVAREALRKAVGVLGLPVPD